MREAAARACEGARRRESVMSELYDHDERVAAEACFAMASRLLYCEPDDAELTAQVEEHLFEAAPFGMENAQVREGLEALDAWCVDAAAEDDDARTERFAALHREWFRLFVGAGTPDAPSWESFYVDPNSQLFSRNTLEVRAFYERYGLRIERLHAEPDDHLGLMLGFLGHLIGRELDAEAEAAEGVSADASQVVADQEALLVEHLLPWLPAWHYGARKHASSDYFRGVADLVFGLVVHYARRFGIAFDEESQSFKKDVRPGAGCV